MYCIKFSGLHKTANLKSALFGPGAAVYWNLVDNIVVSLSCGDKSLIKDKLKGSAHQVVEAGQEFKLLKDSIDQVVEVGQEFNKGQSQGFSSSGCRGRIRV